MTNDRTSAREQAEAILAELDGITATAYRDPTPIPVIGAAEPVPQPGRPPMSQKATDASGLMLAAGIISVPIGGSLSLVLYTIGHVSPTALAIGGAAPVALILALGSLIRAASRGMQGVGAEHHHHYAGPVHQEHRTVSTETRGLFAKTINKQ
jgi:hypothetical protein